MSIDLNLFGELASKTHKEQAVWFLNSMWEKGCGEAQAETLWNGVLLYNQLDLKRRADGCELDELNAHVFLEKLHETMTVKQLRDKLREIGWEKRPMMFPITIYLILKHGADWHYLVNAPQGGNNEKIEKAQRMLNEANAAVDEAIRAAEAAQAAATEARRTEEAAKAAAAAAAKAAEEARKREDAAKKSAEQARAREADAKAAAEAAAAREAEAVEAKAEMERAVAEVKAQEDARDNKTKDLQKKSEEGGAVSRNKAKAELAAHLCEDPLPLRKAKITLEAADRKAAKALKAATEAREKAEAAAVAAEEARVQAEADAAAAESARRAADAAKDAADAAAAAAERAREEADQAAAAAEAALVEAQSRVAEAEAYLEEQKAAGGPAMGAIWWMERELTEKKRFMPTSKGGIAK